jgi:hypothetical protein
LLVWCVSLDDDVVGGDLLVLVVLGLVRFGGTGFSFFSLFFYPFCQSI